MNKPKYSFIVPVYNTEKYVSTCIESILNQTIKNFELILVNDGSTDRSKQICEQYSKSYNEFIKFINLENSGVSAARNTGLEAADGEYIIFIDSDDYVDKQMIEKINHYNDDMILFDYCEFYEDSNVLKYKKTSDKTKQNLRISSASFFACKKSVYMKNDIMFPVGLLHEDDVVAFKTFFHARTISYIECPLYFYRINRQGSTMTTRSQKMIDDLFTVTESNIEYFKPKMSDNEFTFFINESCVSKLFDYILFDILKNKDVKRIVKRKNEVVTILNQTGVKWKKSEYFSPNSLVLKIFRRCLKYNIFISICSIDAIKTILNKKVIGDVK